VAAPQTGESKALFRQTLTGTLPTQLPRDSQLPDNMRERLIKADELQKAGKIEDAVRELLAVSAAYVQRSAPVKAVAVLRQAVKLRPDDPDVKVAYGDVLVQLRMTEDAAREFAAACAQFERAGRYGEWLDVLRRVIALDSDNLQGRLLLAEALSRAGKTQEAADQFRALGEILLERGEIEDWEKVSERLLFHDSKDVTTAHDLALHYVRAGRHGKALSKLALCYEAVPNDAELLELIIDTLETLGQREKAAVITKELVRTARHNGLTEAANQALQRLYALDPDDTEAREHMGVLRGAVAADTVIELESGGVGPGRRTSHPGRASQVVRAAPPVPTVSAVSAVSAVPNVPNVPNVPAQATEPPPLEDLGEEDFGAGPTLAMAVPKALQPVHQPTVAPPQRPAGKLTPSAAVAPAGPRRGGAPSALPGRPFSQTGSHAPPKLPVAASPAPPPIPDTVPAAVPLPVPVSPPELAARAPLPVSARATVPDASELGDWEAPTARRQGPRPTAVPALDAPASSLDALAAAPAALHDDEEAGFDVEDRTFVDGEEDDDGGGVPQKGAVVTDFVMPASEGPHSDAAAPVVSARRRSNSLPRPRLARRPGTVSELPTAIRDMSKDLGTLDFFIERGFHESAVALFDALQKRHPDSAELRAYRQRIDTMQRR
jgi:tetratricopeptide (TPR) repeat protein